MRRRKIIGERLINSIVPTKPTLEIHSVTALEKCLTNFVESYLVGAATIRIGKVELGEVSVCTYFTAYLLRLAVEHLAIDHPIHISFSACDRFMRIEIEHAEKMSDEVARLLERTALDAGFEPVFGDGIIAFMTRLNYTVELRIYKRTPTMFLSDLYDVFFF